jgi:hypothetical protein
MSLLGLTKGVFRVAEDAAYLMAAASLMAWSAGPP